VQRRPTDQAAVSIRRVCAVVNPASGGVHPNAVAELSGLFAELGLEHEVSELTPARPQDTVRAAIDKGPDVLVVLGGDGTARLAAEMCGPDGPLVAPLSAGTMSRLGHALYGPAPWRETLAQALRRPSVHWMPGGEVDGRAFYCRAVLGAPALFVKTREALRAHKLRHAWRGAVSASRQARHIRLRYQIDGQTGRGLAISLICPMISHALDDDEGALEAAVLDLPNAKAGVRLALSNLFGEWRDDPHVTARPCVSGRAWARHPIPAMLDGELFRLGRQVHARFRPHAFRALASKTAKSATDYATFA
jgi:diacylglycerol kinase family enzyme